MVITFDAFTGNGKNNDYIIKAITFYNISNGGIQTFEFYAPFQWEQLSQKARHTNAYIKTCLMNRGWYDGHISYNQLPIILLRHTENVDEIYSKGENCVSYLSSMLGRQVFNVEDVIRKMSRERVEEIRKNLHPLKCISNHSRIAITGLAEYTCCQDRAWLWGNILINQFLDQQQQLQQQ